MVCSHSTTTGGGKQKRQTKMEEVAPPISEESDLIIDMDTVDHHHLELLWYSNSESYVGKFSS